MASVTRESIGNLHDKLTVRLEKQDYLPAFEKDLKSYSKNANIPGFRKGMVPAGMIKKMYGKQLYTETVLKSAENELRNYLVNEKVDIFGQPLFLSDAENFPNIDLQQPADYEFLFEIGLRPDVDVKLPESDPAIFYKVEVKPEDIDQRIESFQTQFGTLQDAEVVEGPENIVYITISETDEDGNVKADGFTDDTSLYVKVFKDEFQKQLLGKKKDDVLRGRLSDMIDPAEYPAVYEKMKLNPENTDEAASHVEIKITGVHTLDKAPLNEELYKKAFPAREITTEDDFRKAVADDEQKYWDEAASNYLEHTLYHQLLNIPVSLPEAFLKKMMNDPEHPQSAEDIDQKYPAFANQLKWSLITGKIVQENNLQVTADEIRQNIKDELTQYFGNINMSANDDSRWLDEYVERVMADRKQIEQRQEKLTGKKVFDWARSQASVKEQEISQEDFKKLVEEHNHHH